MKSAKARPAALFWRKNGIDLLVTLGMLAFAGLICALLSSLGGYSNYVSMIFILAVFLIARLTNGYRWGILASLVSVLVVNYIFTYPYLKFNFTIAGYPLTILCMLVVSIATSTVTTRAKQNERIRIEAEAEKARGNLLRAVSHDLRTPLTSILGTISTVIENDGALGSAERIQLLRGAQSDAQWLVRMTENLLAITRIDAERANIVKTPEAAEEVVSEAVAKFKKSSPGIAVSVRVPDELLMIPMDATLIEQVLLNLLENAAQHGVTADRVELSVERKGDKAEFSVRDNGVGIPEERLAGIFSSRAAAAAAGGDSRRNMGIGLSVCQTIIRAHGGTMAAGNAPGGGAVFRFELGLGGKTDGE